MHGCDCQPCSAPHRFPNSHIAPFAPQVTAPLPAINTWVHVAVTYNGHALMAYVGGRSAGVSLMSGQIAEASTSTVIGADIDGNNTFIGAIRNVSISLAALSAEQIGNLSATPICGAGQFYDINLAACTAADNCLPGSRVATGPTANTNRICAPCDGDSGFSTSVNQVTCTQTSPPCLSPSFEVAAPSKWIADLFCLILCAHACPCFLC